MQEFTGVELYNSIRPHLGEIIGTGCHSTDTKNIENFKKYHELLNCVLEELDSVIYYSRDSHEQSVIGMRSNAIDIILDIKAWISDYDEIHEKSN